MGDLQVFDLSVIGFSHVKKNIVCQDSALSFCDDNMAVAIVCDGHGGKKYFRSHRGSQIAAETTFASIRAFMSYQDQMIEELRADPDKVLGQLKKNIISNWNQAVNQDVQQNPFSEAELATLSGADRLIFEHQFELESAYGTTIIAFVISKSFCFGLQIGDGKCCAVCEDGEIIQPIPWDNKCILNVTTSICNNDAFANFRHYFSESLPLAVFVGTDGIDDSFAGLENLYDFYKKITLSFGALDFDAAVNELKEFLPKLSEKGSGDDVSVAAVLNIQGKSITENLFRSPQSTNQPAESDEIGTDYSNQEQPEADEIECE
ncbi:protein phosphatase 2C domain-containing protein [Acetobacterium fimetarium]|uniref:Protein phosphatase 2C domain-containing protein n=1 Tax=Acetobacterium fimetarium TaxID=52691 RepID=A0ABR6WWZ6_9FIRM|nr:protein phosphatase 2C domain-containing protein [Acetobacterium fimetarium]MBC3804764.1 protein phosphatase 2C domain-containing protein [Acetobacterium fimetarium]